MPPFENYDFLLQWAEKGPGLSISPIITVPLVLENCDIGCHIGTLRDYLCHHDADEFIVKNAPSTPAPCLPAPALLRFRRASQTPARSILSSSDRTNVADPRGDP